MEMPKSRDSDSSSRPCSSNRLCQPNATPAAISEQAPAKAPKEKLENSSLAGWTFPLAKFFDEQKHPDADLLYLKIIDGDPAPGTSGTSGTVNEPGKGCA